MVAKNPPRSKKKSLLAYSDASKLKLKQPPKSSTVEVPSKMSIGQEGEKDGEKIKFFKRHKMKRRALHDTRLSKKLMNRSKGVALHVARMKSARGSNYSFEGSHSGGDDFPVSILSLYTS